MRMLQYTHIRLTRFGESERSLEEELTMNCRRVGNPVVCLSLFCCFIADAQAQERYELTPGLTFGGNTRLRGEFRDDFGFGDAVPGNDEEIILTRLRLNLKWTPVEWMGAFVELQDARIHNEDEINEDAVPTIFADQLDFHQAYIDLMPDLFEIPVRLRVGRQKLSFGTQRLVSPLEWVNTARVWDGGRLTIGDKDRSLDAFATRLVAPDNGNLNDWAKTGNRLTNSDFHGIYYSDKVLIPDTTVEGYWLLRHESDMDDEVHTLGARGAYKNGPWDADAEAAIQFGDYGDDDHEAFMAHAGGGYTFEDYYNLRLGAAYNFGSGDDDPADGDHETFDNLYPLNHAYYGYMDFFSLQNLHNVELTAQAAVVEDLVMRIGYQAFWLVEEDDDSWYHAGAGVKRPAAGGGADSYVGSEIDLTLKYPLLERIALEFGYSHFFTGDYVEDTGPSSDADFAYLQTMISF